MAKIYESPDRGETVYVRNMGSQDRELHSVSSTQLDVIKHIREDQLWGQIRLRAQTDPGLQELLDCAIMYYKLKYDNR
jgi:hypothetical protein